MENNIQPKNDKTANKPNDKNVNKPNDKNVNKPNDKTANKQEEHKSGCLPAIIVIIVIIAVIATIIILVGKTNIGSSSSKNTGSTSGSSSTGGSGGNSGSTSTPKLFYRNANNGDIVVDSSLDFSSLGAKISINPQTDISSLSVKLTFLDKDKKPLKTMNKYIGNVTEGNVVSFSVSLIDLGLSVSWNTNYVRIEVVSGQVSYFA